MTPQPKPRKAPLHLVPLSPPSPPSDEELLRQAEAKIAGRRAAEEPDGGLTAITATLAREAAELEELHNRHRSSQGTLQPSRPSANSGNSAGGSVSRSSSPACGQCSDSGIRVVAEEAVGVERLVVVEWFETGCKRVPLVFCSCQIGRDRAWRWSGLPDEARGVELSRLRAIPDQDDALDAIEAFVERPLGFCTLAGGYGVGKTTLFYAALNELARNGIYGAYRSAPDLLDDLRSAIDDASKGSAIARLRRFGELPVVAVDECDKVNDTGWAFEQLQKFFEHRYRERGRLGTLIGYNLDRASLLPGYLRSRVGDGRFQLVEMRGSDVRPAMREELSGNDPRHVWDRGER